MIEKIKTFILNRKHIETFICLLIWSYFVYYLANDYVPQNHPVILNLAGSQIWNKFGGLILFLLTIAWVWGFYNADKKIENNLIRVIVKLLCAPGLVLLIAFFVFIVLYAFICSIGALLDGISSTPEFKDVKSINAQKEFDYHANQYKSYSKQGLFADATRAKVNMQKAFIKILGSGK